MKTETIFANPLVHLFLGRNVTVELENLEVSGQLVQCRFGDKIQNHKPSILILQNSAGWLILRGNWFSIKTAKEVKPHV